MELATSSALPDVSMCGKVYGSRDTYTHDPWELAMRLCIKYGLIHDF
jgi:hypothetical protein